MPQQTVRLDVPLLLTNEVVHLGTLEGDRRGTQHTNSQEGPALSVSHAPHAWQRIARLGGEPLQVLTRSNGCFVDALELLRNPVWTDVLDAWALQEGLINQEQRWKAWTQDLETDEWCFSMHESEAAAMAVVEDDTGAPAHTGQGPDGQPAVEAVQERLATPHLAQRMGLSIETLGHNVQDMLLLAWVEAHLPEVDGVWWTNTYDPYGHSAPRGGIFPGRVKRWAVALGRLEAYDDDEHGQRMNVDVQPFDAVVDALRSIPWDRRL